MNKKQFYTILFLLKLFSFKLLSQINCTVPLPPVLTSVSVDPETSKTSFTWIPSESSDIAAYIIYTFSGGDGQAIDTVWDPSATSDVISNTAPKYGSVSYVVAAHRLSAIPGLPGCTSPLSNDIATIFCEVSLDTCNKKLNVSWNSYPSVPRRVTGYTLMLSVDNGAYSAAASTNPDTYNFTLQDFMTDSRYCFYVRAELEGGSFSSSNLACVLTAMQRPPGWINADFATVASGNVELSFTVDPESQITDFLLERKSGSAGSFTPLARLKSANGNLTYSDKEADINTINCYRLSAVNSCGIPATVSNSACNMVLTEERKGNLLNLTWNPYRQWTGSVSEYTIFADTGTGFGIVGTAGAADSTFSLDYREIMYEVSGKDICLYVSASESSNPHGIDSQSNSSLACIETVEVITVPNLFTPDNDLKNDLFRPVLSFQPVDYHLIVSDPHGGVLFETRDEYDTWDGMRNGKVQPEGVYLWFLRVTTPSGKRLTRTGTVTIVRNP